MSKLVTLLSVLFVGFLGSDLALANTSPLKELPKTSKQIGSAGFAKGINLKLFTDKATATYFVPQSNFTVTSPKSCDELDKEWSTSAGLDSIDSQMQPYQLYYLFFFDCKELATNEKVLTAAGFLISYGEEGDKILNGEYAKSAHEFYGQKIRILKPEQTMAYVNIEQEGAGLPDVEHWILMNVPLRNFGNLMDSLMAILDVGGAAARKESMTKFLSSHLPDLDIQKLDQQLVTGIKKAEFMIFPIFQAEGEIFNYYLTGMAEKFKCQNSCY